MRTLIDIPDADLKKLNRLSKAQKTSRAQLVRKMISEGLKRETEDTLDKIFGIWKDRNIDGLEYQERMRREWEREF